jgi:hypothetical protein
MQEAASEETNARTKLMMMAIKWRTFGYAFPMTYAMAFANNNPDLRPDEKLLETLAIPIQKVMAEISGEEHSLEALRGFWALIHGFMLLELSEQFRRGGNLEAAFTHSVEAFLNGWERKYVDSEYFAVE